MARPTVGPCFLAACELEGPGLLGGRYFTLMRHKGAYS